MHTRLPGGPLFIRFSSDAGCLACQVLLWNRTVRNVVSAGGKIKQKMKKFIALLMSATLLGGLDIVSAQPPPLPSSPGRPSSTNTFSPPVFTNFPVLTNTFAWTNVPPGWTNHPAAWTNPPAVFTNLLSAFTNAFRLTNSLPLWTNNAAFTNAPPPANSTNHGPRTVPPGPGGASKLPPNVQTVIQQFNQQRAQLIDQLNNASDTQRQQVLQQLATLREQLQDQMATWRQQANDQALQMKSKFNNGFGPLGGNPATSGSGTGRPGHP